MGKLTPKISILGRTSGYMGESLRTVTLGGIRAETAAAVNQPGASLLLGWENLGWNNGLLGQNRHSGQGYLVNQGNDSGCGDVYSVNGNNSPRSTE